MPLALGQQWSPAMPSSCARLRRVEFGIHLGNNACSAVVLKLQGVLTAAREPEGQNGEGTVAGEDKIGSWPS